MIAIPDEMLAVDLEFSVRTTHAIRNSDSQLTVGQLREYTPERLKMIPGLGARGIKEIQEMLGQPVETPLTRVQALDQAADIARQIAVLERKLKTLLKVATPL